MSKTIISILIVLPLAAAIGGFAGWAAGSASSEWLETLGVTEMGWGARIGAVLGAFSCPAYVARKVIQDEQAMTKTKTKQRETRTS